MPPLNALKAFEAAARHESFAKAAEELGVTPAAVSHQVKILEGWLGSPLFRRHAQGLSLNAPGRQAASTFAAAFDALGSAVQELRSASPRAKFDIAALPSVAQLWLAPRLPRLRAAFPKIRFSVHALETPPDFRREPYDLAIFFLREPPKGCRTVALCEDYILPACSPKIAKTLHAADDLSSHSLLWDTSWSDDWRRWLTAARAPTVGVNQGPSFSLYSLAVQAALEGDGVLMAHEVLVTDAIASGGLVAPFELRITTGRKLEILAPESASAQTTSLVEWLVAETRRPAEARPAGRRARRGSSS
jgi:LysR family transcriptional regulator, glycine cleavage system transcriptional activator